MKTIGVFNNKGGSGKTAVSTALACSLKEAGASVVLFDLDPQATATHWADMADVVDGEKLSVQSVVGARLEKSVEAAADAGVQYAIIDTAAKSEADARIAASLCDLLLLVSRPSTPDLLGAKTTVSLIELARKRACTHVVFNAVVHPSHLDDSVEAVGEAYQLPICPVHVGHYVVFQHAYRDGLSVTEADRNGRAAEQVTALANWVVSTLKKGARR